jgi:hypothetical protein
MNHLGRIIYDNDGAFCQNKKLLNGDEKKGGFDAERRIHNNQIYFPHIFVGTPSLFMLIYTGE